MLFLYNKLIERFGKQHWWPHLSKEKEQKRFEIIIGTILTQNTSWSNVERSIKNLHDNNLIDIDKIINISDKRLANLIRSSGYFNQKAKRLKTVARFLKKNKNPGREELLEVNGIGKETADSILLYAYNKPYFVVDAYTRRIFNRLGYKEDSYDELQELFHTNLPKDYKLYNEFHALLVNLGKEVCKTKPLCKKCPLNKGCEFGKKELP